MNKSHISRLTEEKIREMMSVDAAHDWWHIVRVRAIAATIAKAEGEDGFLVDMIALLHDVYDPKLRPVDDEESAILELFREISVADELGEFAKIIAHDAANLGWRGGDNTEELSKVGQIAQDADRLDAIGAIGIARVFAFNGAKHREIYDPEAGIREVSPEEYRDPMRKTHAIQHFYEKLLKLRDTLNTESARQIASERHEFMEQYLDEFFAEWNGER